MSLPAGMQCDLLPPLSARTAGALIAGTLEPGYDIAGDAFDYALNGADLHLAIFNGLGHGLGSTLLTGLAVRGVPACPPGRRTGGWHARRCRRGPGRALRRHRSGDPEVAVAVRHRVGHLGQFVPVHPVAVEHIPAAVVAFGRTAPRGVAGAAGREVPGVPAGCAR
jgi:hypothetical protein